MINRSGGVGHISPSPGLRFTEVRSLVPMIQHVSGFRGETLARIYAMLSVPPFPTD
jgi:hypothetical protein